MKNRKFAVKLTENQWEAVTTALYEWGLLTRGEAENNNGTVNKSMDNRGLALIELSTKIGIAYKKEKYEKR